MKKSDKIFLLVIGVSVCFVVLFLLRYNEVFPMGYHSIGLEGDYVKVQCIRYGKDVVNTLTDADDIEECVDKVNEFKVRKADWFDRLVGRDGEPKEGMLGGCEKYILIFEDAQGEETTIEFPYSISKGGDMSYIKKLCSK